MAAAASDSDSSPVQSNERAASPEMASVDSSPQQDATATAARSVPNRARKAAMRSQANEEQAEEDSGPQSRAVPRFPVREYFKPRPAVVGTKERDQPLATKHARTTEAPAASAAHSVTAKALVCLRCRHPCDGAHTCDICGYPLHLICASQTIGDEGYGQKVICDQCANASLLQPSGVKNTDPAGAKVSLHSIHKLIPLNTSVLY